MKVLLCFVAACSAVGSACSGVVSDRVDVSRYIAEWRTLPAAVPPPGAVVQPSEPPAGSASLTMSGGVRMALVSNPSLRVLRLRAGAVRAGAEVAGGWDNPVLSAELRSAIDGRPEPWFVAAGVAFTVPLSARHDRRRDQALAAATVEQLTVLAQEQAMATQVRVAWLDWSMAVREVALYEAYLAALDPIERIATRLATAGELPLGERRVLPIERARAEIEADRVRAEVEARHGALMAMLGLTPRAAVAFVASLTAPGDASPPVSQWPAQHVRVRLAQAGVDLAAYATARAQAQRAPDLTLGPVVEYDGGSVSVGVALSLPIPSLDLNRRGLAEARGEQRVARARAELEIQALVWARAQQLRRLERATQRLAKLRKLEQQAAAQLKQIEDLAAKGELNTLLVRHAMRQTLTARLAIARERHVIAVASAVLVDLGGAP